MWSLKLLPPILLYIALFYVFLKKFKHKNVKTKQGQQFLNLSAVIKGNENKSLESAFSY
jgi:hypothetical protein